MQVTAQRPEARLECAEVAAAAAGSDTAAPAPGLGSMTATEPGAVVLAPAATAAASGIGVISVGDLARSVSEEELTT